MKIYKRKEFLALPAGTVFCDYTPHVCGPISVKTTGPDGASDFCRQGLDAMEIDASSSEDLMDKMEDALENGTEFPLVFDSSGRDGMFKHDALFAVLDDADVKALIESLTTKWRDG